MCEFASVVATTDGPLILYAAPGIRSHGDARAGWKIKGGAEVEWTGENHNSLLVRHEDEQVAKTIKAMLVDKFANRSAMLATITETRGLSGEVVFYRDGKRIFTVAEAGPQAEDLNDLLAKLPTLPYFKPTAECSEEILEQLVAEHLHALGTYCKDPHQFDEIALKIVRDPAALAAMAGRCRSSPGAGSAAAATWYAAWDAKWSAAKWSAAWSAAWYAARDAARDAAWYAARDAAYAARDAAKWSAAAAAAAAWDAARDAARDAEHMVADLPNNPWAPLVEMWALGAAPIGIVGDEFVVYVPQV